MIRYTLNAELEQLRTDFRTWILENPPPQITRDSSLESFIQIGRKWQAKLAQDRWVAVHWPHEYGGRGLSLAAEALIQEELASHASPQLLGLFGLSMVGPILIRYGSEEQRSRYLSKILSAKEIWCQGFSETEAGSDLAALKTRAEFDEERKGFVVTGSKVWTSFAHIADWCFLLCRSSDELDRYKGFSYLLIDMKSPGITVRPLRQISGESEFNEVFFDQVFVPESCLVGQRGEGWKIAISTLMYERVILTFARQLQSELLLRDLIKAHTQRPLPVSQQVQLAREVAKVCAVRALALQHLLHYASGNDPGPEGSLDKLGWTESFQSLVKLAHAIGGEEQLRNEEENSDTLRYLYSRGRSIAAGTSEIQRNIIAERILKLPRIR